VAVGEAEVGLLGVRMGARGKESVRELVAGWRGPVEAAEVEMVMEVVAGDKSLCDEVIINGLLKYYCEAVVAINDKGDNRVYVEHVLQVGRFIAEMVTKVKIPELIDDTPLSLLIALAVSPVLAGPVLHLFPRSKSRLCTKQHLCDSEGGHWLLWAFEDKGQEFG
jgi:hypothetical protein